MAIKIKQVSPLHIICNILPTSGANLHKLYINLNTLCLLTVTNQLGKVCQHDLGK